MRGVVVLTGMLIAAAAAMLVWLDATGQLRPWLTTTPMVVIELAPPPAATTEAATASESATASDDATAAAPTATGEAVADTETATDETPATEPAGLDADAEVDAEVDADFGDGAVALSDVPIADGETAGAADEAATSATAAGAEAAATTNAADSTQPETVDESPPEDPETSPDADADEGGTAAEIEAVTETAADSGAEIVVPVADGNATAAADAIETPLPKPDETAIDPAALQTAALPSPPRDPNLPWQLYAAPFSDGDPRPRIAIVFTSLGLSDGATEAIIQQLPGAVTLAFSPYSRKLRDWIERARAKGHEVLVELPMEPLNYPEDDPGPLALLSERPSEDNVTRLVGILDRAEGVVGVAGLMGSRFTSDEELLRPILVALADRGFLYVDNGTAPVSVVPALARRIAVPIAINDQYLDTEASRIAIDGRLQQIERIARSEGAAVAFASPYPITIERLIAWIPTLEAKGFVLAPVTATVGHQDLP